MFVCLLCSCCWCHYRSRYVKNFILLLLAMIFADVKALEHSKERENIYFSVCFLFAFNNFLFSFGIHLVHVIYVLWMLDVVVIRTVYVSNAQKSHFTCFLFLVNLKSLLHSPRNCCGASHTSLNTTGKISWLTTAEYY